MAATDARAPMRWLARLLVSLLAFAALATAGSACFVEEHCTADADCESPAICDDSGRCALECQLAEDCPRADLCVGHRCVPAPGCAGCAFAHAKAVCTHGDCAMGACHSGFDDLNGLRADGCEYFCVAAGDERCNERDDDCDGEVDEGFELTSDPAHCGACDHACPTPPHTEPGCDSSQCTWTCVPGWFDNNGEASDGCEDADCEPADEVCDGRDNDCDGAVDEGFDKTQPETCGPYCVACAFPNAEALCVDGACARGDCNEGWHDLDGRDSNGCEYACLPTGDEVCDAADNDCDGAVDEGLLCCPDDMVAVEGLFCLDRYEASVVEVEGVDRAASEAGVLPYWRRDLTVAEAEGWCQAAGKRLCNGAEWALTCQGPDETEYAYGDDYEPTTCNGIDAFGAGGYHLAPTGSFPYCSNAYGAFDLNGNVWEMTADGKVRGGAYNCLDSEALHRCAFSIDPSRVIAIGFRCCR